MKQKILKAIVLFALGLATMIVTASLVSWLRTDWATAQVIEVPKPLNSDSSFDNENFDGGLSTSCALKPEKNPTTPRSRAAITSNQLTLERFRRSASNLNSSTQDSVNSLSSSKTLAGYTPREAIALANPTNYGKRFILDLYGRPADRAPIVVLHETVSSASSAINMFRTPHFNDADQVSYHTLINLNGDIIYIVPPDQRAFGAGDSTFRGDNGSEAVKTHPNYPSSVNNFAYHISLETPVDGRNNRSRHSGYTSAQYQSLAWLVAKTGVPDFRITTHKGVDRSGLRQDPRSFNSTTFFRLLDALPKTNEITIDCQAPLNDR
jgi:hypothetical protein